MAEEKKSFSEFVNQAPAQDDTVSLVGAIGRSSQPGKFVLNMGPGNVLTLDVDAVKNYQVLGGGVGQSLVQIDVARESVPASALVTQSIYTPPIVDYATVYYFDHNPFPKAWYDPKPLLDPGPTFVEGIDNPFGNLPDPATGAIAPFALATAHQASQATLAAMQGQILGFLGPHVTGVRDVHKLPWLEGVTGRPPHFD